jgi:hypothetical protein
VVAIVLVPTTFVLVLVPRPEKWYGVAELELEPERKAKKLEYTK